MSYKLLLFNENNPTDMKTSKTSLEKQNHFIWLHKTFLYKWPTRGGWLDIGSTRGHEGMAYGRVN